MTVAPGRVGGLTRHALVAELAEVVGAAHEARFIVEEAAQLGLASGRPAPRPAVLDEEAVAAARRMAARRAAGEPLQYVFGHWPFRALDLLVDRRVLVPRPETEQVVEVALAELRRHDGPDAPRMVDAGTGSGAIALSLAGEIGRGVVWATDTSAAALAVASRNLEAVRRRGAEDGSSQAVVHLAEGSWLEPLPFSIRGAVALVVSNPPYVAEEEWLALAPEVRSEPRAALVAGPGSDGTPGLAGVEAVLRQARDWLAPGAPAVVELAPRQAEPATRLARRLGYADVRVEPDLTRRPRALVARTGDA